MDIGNIFEEWDFSGTVPLPYRVLLMGCIGVFAWASNLHLLAYLRVDVPALLFSNPPLPGHHTRPHLHRSSSTRQRYSVPSALIMLYRATYMLGVAFLAMTLFNMSMYKWVVSDSSSGSIAPPTPSTNPSNVATASPATTRGGIGRPGNPRSGILVPVFGYMTILMMLFIPFNILFMRERYRFLRSMKKVCFSGFSTNVSFSDVILADILTSFARVLGDLAVALCLMFWDRDGSTSDSCYNSILVPIMTSVPYFIRLRQCLTEYKDSNYKVQRHMMNALKYASAFPVILISSMQKSAKAAALKGEGSNQAMLSDNALYRFWLFFVALNSFYSFYWDIKHDWMLIEKVPGSGYSSISGAASSIPNSGPSGPSRMQSPPVIETTDIHKGSSTATANAGMTPTSKSSMGLPVSPKLAPSNSNSSNNSSNSPVGAHGGSMNPFASPSSHYYSATTKRLSSPTLSLMNPWTWWPWFHHWSGLSSFRMRHYLHYEEAYFYLFAIILDFLLRTTWMMKVFGNVQIEEYEGGVFTMECLEVLRRWVWVIFRLEAEMVKRQGPSSPSLTSTAFFVGGSGADDAMGGDDDDTIPMTSTNPSATSVSSIGTVVSSGPSNGDLGKDVKLESSTGGSHMAMSELKR